MLLGSSGSEPRKKLCIIFCQSIAGAGGDSGASSTGGDGLLGTAGALAQAVKSSIALTLHRIQIPRIRFSLPQALVRCNLPDGIQLLLPGRLHFRLGLHPLVLPDSARPVAHTQQTHRRQEHQKQHIREQGFQAELHDPMQV